MSAVNTLRLVTSAGAGVTCRGSRRKEAGLSHSSGLVTSAAARWAWPSRAVKIVIAALCIGPLMMRADATPAADDAALRTFFSTYCVECHGPDKQKADRRFDQLALTIENQDALLDLQDIIDQLNLGDMPPADAARRPTPDEARSVVDRLTALVRDGHARLASTGRQTVLRRLNRREYLNTVGDLFGLNMLMFDPTTKFPRDDVAANFDNIGDTLKTSGYLLAQYLEAADQVVEKALAAYDRPAEQTWRFAGDFRQQPELRYSHGKVHNYRYLCLYETTNSDKHEGAYGPLLAFAQGVPADGTYEIRVKAEAKHRKNGYDPKFFGTDPSMPFRLGVVAGNAAAGPLHLPQPIEPQLGEVLVKDDTPEWHTFRVWLDRGFTPRFTFPNGMLSVRNAYGRLLRQYNHLFPEELRDTKGIVEARVVVMRHGQLPHIRIHEVEIRGPLPGPWPPAGHMAVLGSEPFASDRTREILERFASRAYRRPARPDEVDRLMGVVDRRRAQGHPPLAALKDGLKAALCSPGFLYLVEPDPEASTPRELSPHALASRLSYFLWSTMPDPELRRRADSGELRDPAVLLAQVRRLLASPRSDAFVSGFLDAWLNLRSLGDMPPDRGTFARFYSHDLQPAMKRETQLFTRDLLMRNESIVRFLDADYTFANRPLARLYGIDEAIAPETGHEFQRLALPNRQRGGLLGQGSVLTVSANGIETSPVMRGVWVLNHLLGTPPAPPPDNVPPIDPDIRGAKSMREILARHRDNASCYECHRKIDPFGFALENFDPIGAWRTHYGKAAPVDSSGELADGRKFSDVAGLKDLLVERKHSFARTLTERLMAYACGRRMEPLDRPAVDAILSATQPDDYRFRDLLEQVVLSEVFRTK